MTKFKFRLQNLLDIRLHKEEESKIEFKKAQDDKILSEEKLKSLKINYDKYSSTLYKGSIVEQKIAQAYLNSLTLCIDETIEEINNKSVVLEEKRDELKKKQVERKTVEILKEKQKSAFEKEQNQIEQIANDEFALYGFMRNFERRWE